MTTVALARAGGGFDAAPLRWRKVAPLPERPREPDAGSDPWGADEGGVSPGIAGLACGAAVVVVALAGWLAG